MSSGLCRSRGAPAGPYGTQGLKGDRVGRFQRPVIRNGTMKTLVLAGAESIDGFRGSLFECSCLFNQAGKPRVAYPTIISPLLYTFAP